MTIKKVEAYMTSNGVVFDSKYDAALSELMSVYDNGQSVEDILCSIIDNRDYVIEVLKFIDEG